MMKKSTLSGINFRIFKQVLIVTMLMLVFSNSELFSQDKPGPGNTGPTGTLEAMGGSTISVDGTVIEDKHITGCMHIKASNVTIRNCVIDGDWDWYAVRCDYGDSYTDFLIEDCELIKGKSALIKGSNFTMRGCNLHEGNGDAIKPITNCLVESNWIHHLGMADGAHADGVQSRDGGSNMVFRYNNFDMPFDVEPPYKSNSPFIVQTSNGIVSMVIEYNWINGGSYTMNLGNNAIVVRNNIFGRDYAYGIFYPGSDNFNSCNTWEDTGESMDDCSGDIGTNVTGVTVKPNSVNLSVNENTSLTAEITPKIATNKNVTWTSDDETVATVDSNGKVTAVAEGTANITATTEDGGFTANSLVTVFSDEPQPPVGEGGSYTLNPVEDAYVRDVYYSDRNFGAEKELHVKRSFSSQSMQTFLKFDLSQIMAADVESAVLRLYVKDIESEVKHHINLVDDDTWTETGISHDTKPVSGEELNSFDLDSTQTGAYIEVDIVKAVKSEAGEMMSLNIHTDEKIHRITTFASRESDNKPELVINGGGEPGVVVAVTGVEISPDMIEMKTGETHTFIATVSPSDANNKSVQWEIAPTNLASIDQDGKLKALAEGTVTVTAQTVDGDFTATSTVNITKGTTENPDPGTGEGDITIYPVADLFVRGGTYESENYGNNEGITVKSEPKNPTYDRFIYMKFDLSDISNSFGSARLRLMLKDINGDAASTQHIIMLVEDDTWTESGTNYQNKPPAASGITEYQIPDATNTYFDVDITQAVIDNTGGLFSIQISSSNSSSITYYSKESDNKPAIIISDEEIAPINATGVSLKQQALSLSKGTSATLSAEVEPYGATIKTVSWSSADPAIATVDNNGKITAVSTGTTTITVTSDDGGFTATCSIVVRAANQLMNLDEPDKNRFQLPLDLVWPDEIGEGHVCLWHKDRIAAASISIDDNIEFQHDWWREMSKKYPDVKCTWMVMPSTVHDWNSFQKLIDLGHSVDAHDLCEVNELPDDEYLERTAKNKETINEKLTNNECLVYAYPCGDPKNTISRDLFICMRGTVGHINHANKTNYLNLKSRSGLSDLHDIRILLDEKEKLWSSSYKRGWLSYHYHKVGNEEGTEKFLAELQLKSDSIWTGSHANVAKYGQERDSHTLTIEEVTNDKIQFNITDKMYDEIFDFPLTIKFRVPDSWASVASTQDGKPVDNEIVEKSGKKYVYVYPVPDRGTVIINATEKDPDVEDPNIEDPNTEEPSDSTNVEEPGDITTGIQQNGQSVSIWPNPITSDKELSMNLSGFNIGQKLSIKIIDGMGRQVYNKSNTVTQERMLLTLKLNGQLQQGYYILQISDGTHSIFEKLLIQ